MADKIILHTRPEKEKYKNWDTIGFSETLEKFINIFDILKPPITVGLYGKWGSGKTEMIKAIEEELKEKEYATLIFDAWKYRNEKNIILPIICALEKKYSGGKKETKQSVRKLLIASSLIMTNQILKNKLGLEIGDIKASLAVAEDECKHYQRYVDEVNQIEKEFKFFIDFILKESKKEKILIFIDNLDRCFSETVINLLEDISTFFHIGKCIFILAMDEDIVKKGIERKYADFNGKHYLEKIIQTVLKMPTPAIENSNNVKSGIYHFMKRYEIAKGYSKHSQQGDKRDSIFKAAKNTISGLFEKGILGNPRRIERIVNKIVLLERLKAVAVDNKNISLVVLMIVLKEYFPMIYNLLHDIVDYGDFLAFVEMSAGEGNSPDKMKTRDGKAIRNHTMYKIYMDNNDFYQTLKFFYKTKNQNFGGSQNELIKQMMTINQYLDIIA